jgi:hypothetical protein
MNVALLWYLPILDNIVVFVAGRVFFEMSQKRFNYALFLLFHLVTYFA